jgi:hypothetical protein
MAIRKPTKSRSASRKPTSASRAASAYNTAKNAAKAAGAKFGGVFKRQPTSAIHKMASSDYRMTPYFSRPKVIAKPSVTLEQAYRGAFPPDLRNARTVHLRTLRPAKTPGLKAWADLKAYRATTFTDDNKHHHEILVMFQPNDKGDLDRKSRIVVSCTCPRHAFGMEYRGARKGMSFIYYSNGQPPTVLFPPSTCCKHVFRVLNYLMQGKRAANQPDTMPMTAHYKQPLAPPAKKGKT